MSYTAATFFIDLEGGSDTARADLVPTAYADNGSGLVRVTCNNPSAYANNAVFDIAGTTSSVYNGAWKVTIIDATHVDLLGSTYSVNPAAKGTMIPRGGSSKTDAWLVTGTGATAARVQPGDTIRYMASPDEQSLGINATWTRDSKTVTLASALNATIDNCESAWTASANVTSTADAAAKQGTKSAKHVIAAGFTTGLASFFATGALNLSAYEQVSFWIFNSVAVAASTLSLRLCSDVAGVTTVDTIAIPAIPSSSQWVAFTVDKGSALGASIQSVALYADLDPGAVNISLDNIIACKASASDDALSLTSMIGKVHNLCWAATTAYAANSIRKPTQPNRNGFRYKVTAGGGGSSGGSEPTWPVEIGVTVADGALTWTCLDLEETWYPIQSIVGTTVLLDNVCATAAANGRGYAGDTETVAAYRRKAIKTTMQTNTVTASQSITGAGTPSNPTTYSGGWNRTDMTTQTGETWLSGQNGLGYGFHCNYADLILENCNALRFSFGQFAAGGGNNTQIKNCQSSGCLQGLVSSAYGVSVVGAANVSAASTSGGIDFSGVSNCKVSRVSAHSNLGNNASVGPGIYMGDDCKIDIAYAYNNFSAGLILQDGKVQNGIVTRSNGVKGIYTVGQGGSIIRLQNSNVQEASKYYTNSAAARVGPGNDQVFSQNDGQVAGVTLITSIDNSAFANCSTIGSATDQRHTASGISWKFLPKNVSRSIDNPLRLSVAKVAVAASALVTMKIWARRDSTDIKGQFIVDGGQIAGVPINVTTACEPSINTWTEYTLTFTPSAAGVVEVMFRVWDGVGTANAYWIDDFTVSQA